MKGMVMRDFNTMVVVDFEATCWDEQEKLVKPRGEIIEIGVAIVDLKTLSITNKDRILVKPATTTVSEYCTALTGLTQIIVDTGVSLLDACQYLRKVHKSKDRIWASYGQWDLNQIVSECNERGIPYPFSHMHINIKAVASTALRTKMNLNTALETLGMKFIGTPHAGMDDAVNAARVYTQVIKPL